METVTNQIRLSLSPFSFTFAVSSLSLSHPSSPPSLLAVPILTPLPLSSPVISRRSFSPSALTLYIPSLPLSLSFLACSLHFHPFSEALTLSTPYLSYPARAISLSPTPHPPLPYLPLTVIRLIFDQVLVPLRRIVLFEYVYDVPLPWTQKFVTSWNITTRYKWLTHRGPMMPHHGVLLLIWSTLDQVVTCHLFGTKPLPESVLSYIINWFVRNKLRRNMNENTRFVFHKIHLNMSSAK